MASKAQSSLDHSGHQVKFWIGCCVSPVLSSYVGQTTAVESVDLFTNTVCEVPCFTGVSEGRAYGGFVKTNLHVFTQTMVGPHVGEGAEYGLGDVRAIFYVCLFISVTLDPAAEIFKGVHILKQLPFYCHMVQTTLMVLALLVLHFLVSEGAFTGAYSGTTITPASYVHC